MMTGAGGDEGSTSCIGIGRNSDVKNHMLERVTAVGIDALQEIYPVVRQFCGRLTHLSHVIT